MKIYFLALVCGTCDELLTTQDVVRGIGGCHRDEDLTSKAGTTDSLNSSFAVLFPSWKSSDFRM